MLSLDLERWGGPATDSDFAILSEVEGPVLDVGCGPGRLVEALRLLHVNVLGIDAAPTAIARARARGRRIAHRSVFDPLPREGTWASVLLFDGNIGIGGDPNRLLLRIRDLMTPHGCIFVELEPPGARVEFGHIEFEVATGMVGTFPWCWVGCDEIDNIATGSGLRVDDCRSVDGRWFAQLRLPSDTYHLNFGQ
jgi:SAM-dependent methyltransferase